MTKVCFFTTRVIKERRTGEIPGAFFRDAQGFGRLDAGSCAGFTRSRPPPGPRYFNFPHFCLTCNLEKLELIKPDSSVICLFFLLKTLAVGRRRQHQSIEAALDME